jgi:hypothetical protein
MSLMTVAIGEGGNWVAADREIYERAIAFGHYERFKSNNIQIIPGRCGAWR